MGPFVPKSSKFKPGQAIVFAPTWWDIYDKGLEDYPIKPGDVVHFLAEHSPAVGHCIVVDYDGKITTMLHTNDFRAATDEEV